MDDRQSPVRTTTGNDAVRTLLGCVMCGLLAAMPCVGSVVPPPRPVSPVVEQLLADDILTEAERGRLLRQHGLWDTEDLLTTEHRAEAALQLCRFDDPVFDDPALPAVLRARAAWGRGDRDAAHALLENASGIEAMSMLGRLGWERGDDASTAMLGQAMQSPSKTATDEVERIRAARQHAMATGRTGDAYQPILDALAEVRDARDPLCWSALIEESDLLLEKQRYTEGVAAAWEALELNPRLAIVWYRLGLLSARTFDFDGARAAADVLRDLDAQHHLANLVEAESALVQRDVATANANLAPVLERFPDHPHALALSLVAAELSDDTAEVQRASDRIIATGPGDPRPLTTAGRLLSLHRQFDRAEHWLDEARRAQPRWAPAHVEQGLMQWQAGDDDGALATMRTAVELDPFNHRAANSLSLLEELRTYDSLETPHFILRWAPGVDEALARDMPARMEAVHDDVVARLGWTPSRKTTIELYPDHQHFAVRIIGLPDIHTVAACTGPVIAMEAPRKTLGDRHMGLYNWESVLQHEYTHTVTLDRTGYRIPLWCTEGLAMYMEPAPRDWNIRRLLAAEWHAGTMLEPDELDWGFVRPRREQDRNLAYAQSWLMIEFLYERWGMEGVQRLLDAYRDGVQESNAFPAALGLTRDRFHEDFLAWTGDQLAAWGLRPEPSLESLLTRGDAEVTEDPDEQRRLVWQGLQQTVDDMTRPAGDDETPVQWTSPPQQERIPLTERSVERLLELHPEHPDLLRQSILYRTNASETMDESTLQQLETYVQVRPTDPLGHRLLADHWSIADPSRAVEHLETLAVAADDDPALWMELAKLQRRLGRSEAALLAALQAVTIEPYEPVHRERVAALAIEAGALEAARHQIEALLLLEPDQPTHERRLQAVDAMLER